MAGVGNADVPAVSGGRSQKLTYRAIVPSGVSSGIYMVLEMRDGDRSKPLDKVIRKAVVNMNDIITHMLLKMDVWEQAEIDKPTVETLDGTKNEWGLVHSATWRKGNCRHTAASEVSFYTYISTVSGKPTNKCMVPVLSFVVISGGSHAGTCLACLEFMIVPTAAGSFAKDMITDSEVYHMLNVGHQDDVRRDASNVGDWTDFALSMQDNNQALDFFTESLELDCGVWPRCE